MTGARRSCWAIVPVKPPGAGKTRLAGVLNQGERDRLVGAMLRQVIEAAMSCDAITQVCLVGPSDHGFGERVTLIADHGEGLNAALTAALKNAAQYDQAAADQLIVIAGDLPQLESADIDLLARTASGAIAIAPDRHGTGTNALSLPIAAARAFRCQFGPGSYFAHRAEADRLGYNVETILSDGLAKDIDEPGDLADAAGCLEEMP